MNKQYFGAVRSPKHLTKCIKIIEISESKKYSG